VPSGSVAEVVSVFLKLGTIAFGGPAAHVGLLRDEVVRRRRWVTDERFMDLLGMTNLIPGPNSTEMAIHLGYLRAGWPGLIAGGVCFIVPAMLIVLACAWLYVRWGTLPQAAWLLYGVKPVIIAVVVQAMWSLLRTAVKGPLLAAVGAGVVALYLAGGNEILLLLGGGGVVMLARAGRRLAGAAMVVAGAAAPGAALGQTAGAAGSATLGTLFLLFLNLFLLAVGMLMDVYSAIVIVVPLLVPLGLAFGIHPVHLGIIFLANLELGFLTPPVGQNLFLSSLRFEKPMSYVFRSVIPMVVVFLIGVALITYLPALTPALPAWVGRP